MIKSKSNLGLDRVDNASNEMLEINKDLEEIRSVSTLSIVDSVNEEEKRRKKSNNKGKSANKTESRYKNIYGIATKVIAVYFKRGESTSTKYNVFSCTKGNGDEYTVVNCVLAKIQSMGIKYQNNEHYYTKHLTPFIIVLRVIDVDQFKAFR